jgi:L-cysteine:1D-myo-inositol 2-amino-2-deoxy-alpha-D-glucopyranoside ligase
VLWRPSGPGEPSWEARWGSGRPGWHVECSALALHELGPTIDLHGGGVDLLYPHHECCRAQSEAVTGQPFVRHWMHQAMVHLDGRKMSKSTGNLVFVGDLRERFEGAAIRLALGVHHYRRPWNWTDDLLDEAEERLAAWRWAGPGDGGLIEVRAALDDDLDVPAAIAAVDQAAARGEGIDAAAALLGVAL